MQSRGKSRHYVQDASWEAVAASLLQTAVSGEGWWRAETTIDEPLLAAQYLYLEGRREMICQENLSVLRCIVGNPFRPVEFDPVWRSETAVALAAGIYAERAFNRLPILADALEEAGCDHPDVLAHCRGTGRHARGCWVVEGVLGKVQITLLNVQTGDEPPRNIGLVNAIDPSRDPPVVHKRRVFWSNHGGLHCLGLTQLDLRIHLIHRPHFGPESPPADDANLQPGLCVLPATCPRGVPDLHATLRRLKTRFDSWRGH